MATAKQVEIDIHHKSKSWQGISQINHKINEITPKVIKKTDIAKFLKNTNNKIELSIALVSDAQIRQINKSHLGQDKPTNVLSFPAFDVNSKNKLNFESLSKTQNYIFLGDIILSLETIRKEVAQSNFKNFYGHLTHLLLHSILHLLGHDHLKDKEAQEMEKLEVQILKSLNIKDPYDNH